MKCPHCLVEFYDEKEIIFLGQDSEHEWAIEKYNCPNPKCRKNIYFLINGKFGFSAINGRFYEENISERELVRPRGSARPPVPTEVPKHIANDYEEACLVLPDSPKASAALSRRALQALLRNAAGIASKNADFSLLLINKLQNSNIEIKYSTQDNVDVNQLIIDLGIVNEFNQHIQQINEHIQNVRYRYKNLNILCKENVLTIINDLPIRESYRSSANALRVHNDCNAQFQADMQAIHDQYDSAISMCTIATLLSGGLASPCYLYAVVNAIFQTSFAIDRHKFCELNNQ